MWNIFEQPWTLLGASVLVLFGVLTFRSVWVEKRRWWQWLLPLALAGAAFGLDFLVVTDLEKVHATAAALLEAVENEDCPGVAVLIDSDYSDIRHSSKAALMTRCRQELNGPTVERLKKLDDLVEMSSREAKVTLSLFVRFAKDSRIASQYKQVFLAKIRLHLKKQANGQWLIDRIDMLEVDKQPVTWRNV
ncbi:MAG: hypothetical protein JSW27_11510 [Phycisphaerales bacterium]|nr:MAG: hypothetical protein JSW27_11510 [Phycisphaerales bacterium]